MYVIVGTVQISKIAFLSFNYSAAICPIRLMFSREAHAHYLQLLDQQKNTDDNNLGVKNFQ